ncbi:MAG: hypothetical protein A2527_03240 [Candidatus Lambdaproteobacteria bacterium RIFOXYD2_FULL_50_16]|uniref:Adenylate cyclase class-I N-terminal domain-containing protein n=1 Tax=Candidatus Lambdaproteobacteria bacterium RIFOXYD2_FULL_50_16 TaxID=1817772 RepID=A0A1F6GEQ3_9PROT|nr:MAG: hypothetical protein A2527_03240 [Candidatus Lambdaproteobacteria bacterium RIFOXYD2_FULL_50_16]
MGLFSKTPTKKAAPPTKPAQPKGLESLFEEPVALPPELRDRLDKEIKKGKDLFEKYNKNRLELAFGSFDEPMKHALYDIIYILHTNDPSLNGITYTTTEVVDYKEKEVSHVADLFVEGAPAGVVGLDLLPDFIKTDCDEHLNKTFGHGLGPAPEHCPIIGIFSIGSIGTVGHKHLASDLDLQVVFRINPFLVPKTDLTNEAISKLMLAAHKILGAKVQRANKVTPVQLKKNPELEAKINQLAKQKLCEAYPLLSKQFVTKQVNLTQKLAETPNPKFRNKIVQEVIQLYALAGKRVIKKQMEEGEAALRLKIARLQSYCEERYPTAEIYLFPMRDEDMINGRFGSTLESKESSGSAYELILTYDTLMPGVFFTPVAPSHFMFGANTNNSPLYHQAMDFLRFGVLDDLAGDLKRGIADHGPTPDLSEEYVGRHNGAIYWEAFKGSSGNLPKALMNLSRYETLLFDKTRKTMIQLIKRPEYLESLVTRLPTGPWAEAFLPNQILTIEKTFPNLAYDPWWLRYKVLKIAYCERGLITTIDETAALEMSRVLDLAFALHVRISDVFARPGTPLELTTHREKVLAKFLEKAFPEGGRKRKQLDMIFIGETDAVNRFEEDMRVMFEACIDRIEKRFHEIGVTSEKDTNEEFKIWYHYYKKNFHPQPNVVQPSILTHLKVPRGRVLTGFDKEKGWFFKAFQKTSSKNFGKEAQIAHLPEETLLVERVGFLKGLAYCLLNGYYGLLNQGTLKETFTSLELIRTQIDLGSELDNDYAHVQPDQIEKLARLILQLFPAQKIDYRSCLKKEMHLTEVLICFNLLRFGQISILFRNSLGSLMVEEFTIDKFRKQSKRYHEAYKECFADPALELHLQNMIRDYHIDVNRVKLGAWVNHNSFETQHNISALSRKEQDLNREFRKSLVERLAPESLAPSKTTFETPGALQKVLFGAALVAAIDGGIANKEYTVCNQYLEEHWNPSWGDSEEGFTQVLKNLQSFFSVGSSLLRKNIADRAQEMVLTLTIEQQRELIRLMDKTALFEEKNQANKLEVVRVFKVALDLE